MELFAWLASLCHQRQLALDVACGNGQAAVALSHHFTTVHAIDASAEQIAHAKPASGVSYSVAQGEATGLADSCVDLVTVAQALHWFDLDAFINETRRILSPGGVLAVWCYGLFSVTPQIDAIVNELYKRHTDKWWPPERDHIDQAYRHLIIPGQQHERRFAMQKTWHVDQALAYLRTWSSVQRAIKATGDDPVNLVEGRLRSLWTGPIRVQWPLTIKWSRTL